MTSPLPSRLLAILRHLLVLCTVASLISPQAAHAGMSMDRGAIVAETTMDAHAHNGLVAEMATMDHGTSDACCADMICFYAMPIDMNHGAVRSIVPRVANVLPHDVAPGSISPATLRKPPKHV